MILALRYDIVSISTLEVLGFAIQLACDFGVGDMDDTLAHDVVLYTWRVDAIAWCMGFMLLAFAWALYYLFILEEWHSDDTSSFYAFGGMVGWLPFGDCFHPGVSCLGSHQPPWRSHFTL